MPPSTIRRVLSFDPGFERLGAAVLERDKSARGEVALLFSDCLRTAGSLPFPERLRKLGEAAEKLIAKWKPDGVALEDIFFEKNAKTAMGVAQVRGVLAYIAASNDLLVLHYTPLEVKTAVTGYGKAGKKEVSAMVPRLISLPKKKRLDDELDAIAVGLTCLASTRG